VDSTTTIARGLIIFKSLSRDTAAFHVYETHDRTPSSIIIARHFIRHSRC